MSTLHNVSLLTFVHSASTLDRRNTEFLATAVRKENPAVGLRGHLVQIFMPAAASEIHQTKQNCLLQLFGVNNASFTEFLVEVIPKLFHITVRDYWKLLVAARPSFLHTFATPLNIWFVRVKHGSPIMSTDLVSLKYLFSPARIHFKLANL